MGTRLLIADGDGAWTELYRTIFSQRGYEVETATEGLECLAKLYQFMPRVLLLDLELPRGGAESVLAWIRNGSNTPSVAVVLTAYDAPREALSERLAPPVVQCFRKRSLMTSLLESIRSVAVRGSASCHAR